MIIQILVDFCCNIILGLFSGFELLNFPVEMMGPFFNIMELGVWVIGGDVLGMFFASVLFWWGIKGTIGLALWIYKLLPFT